MPPVEAPFGLLASQVRAALQGFGAPGEVLHAADELATLQDVASVGWTSQIWPSPPESVLDWAVRALGDQGILDPGPQPDLALWLLGSARGAACSAGDRACTTWTPPNEACPPGAARDLMNAFHLAFGHRQVQIQFRALALGAILASRPGLRGLRPSEWVSPSPGLPLPVPPEHARVLAAGQASAATAVFRALHEVLTTSEGPEWAHDALGEGQVPLAWVAYALAMRSGSPAGRGGLDMSPLPPSDERQQQGWGGPYLTAARRFARRAVMTWSDSPQDWHEIQSYGIPTLDPIGTGWIHQQLALNLRGLVEHAL